MSQAFPNAPQIVMETDKVLGALSRSMRND